MEARLPNGVVEVIPDALFVGPLGAVKSMIEMGVRHVVCCLETCDDSTYQRIADEWIKSRKPPTPGQPPQKQQQQEHSEPEVRDVEEPAAASVESAGTEVASSAAVAEETKDEHAEDDDDESLESRLAKVHVAACPMEDSLEFDLSRVVPLAVEFIDAAVRNAEAAVEEERSALREHEDGCPEKVARLKDAPPLLNACYVHCNAGTSRSPAVVVAYLITRRSMLLDDALAQVGPRCRPNPGFIKQLVALEESCTGEPSRFNTMEYFVSGLQQLFPALDEATIRGAMAACSNDVVSARAVLMKRSLLAVNRDEMMIAALVSIVDAKYVTEPEVRQVYTECGKQRDQALLKLLERQNLREEEVRRGLASKSASS